VDPIELALEPVERAAPQLPLVTTPSSWLDARVEFVAPDVPRQVLVVRNLSQRAVRAFSYRLHNMDGEPGSGRRKKINGEPILLPGKELRFELPASSRGEAAWSSERLDRIEIAGVLWDDGFVEGDEALAVSENAVALGQAVQLERLIRLLRSETTAGAATETRRGLSTAERLPAASTRVA